jgi:hypothetical protein
VRIKRDGKDSTRRENIGREGKKEKVHFLKEKKKKLELLNY